MSGVRTFVEAEPSRRACGPDVSEVGDMVMGR